MINRIVIKPYKTVLFDQIYTELDEIQQTYTISMLVIGLPLQKDNSESDITKHVRNSAAKIQEAYPDIQWLLLMKDIAVVLLFEQIKSKGIRLDKENKSLIDMYAAANILEMFLAEN